MICGKHNKVMVRQNAHHYYCEECDRLAMEEVRKVFSVRPSTVEVVCIRCRITYLAKNKQRQYCSKCRRIHRLEYDREKAEARRRK